MASRPAAHRRGPARTHRAVALGTPTSSYRHLRHVTMQFALFAKGAHGRTGTPLLARPPPPTVHVPLAMRMGLIVYIRATYTIVHRDLLIALAQGRTSRTASCHVGQQEAR